MKVYNIANNRINEIKNVNEDYVLLEGDFVGEINGTVGDILINGVWQKDPNVIAEQQKQERITELKQTITNKKLLDMDCTAEQAELKTLLGL